MTKYRGSWRMRVIGTDAMYPQRVVVDGSARHLIPGEIGQERVISGKVWRLRPEYHDGRRWRRSARTSRAMENGDIHIIRIKDTFHFDTHHNDLVLRLERVGAGQFLVTGVPATDDLQRSVSSGLLPVQVTNTSHVTFGYDAVLNITPAGRARLAAHGVLVRDDWSPSLLHSTGQEVFDRGVSVPPLESGASTTIYFQVDAAQVQEASPSVEFELRRESNGREVITRCTAAIPVHEAARLHGITPTVSVPLVTGVNQHVGEATTQG